MSQAHITDSMGRPQETTIINESGLYNVILRSDKPEAKPFRKWVTAVVLPSIRKNGGYIAGQEELSPQELMAKALLVAQKTIADREARISNLEAQKQAMQSRLSQNLSRCTTALLYAAIAQLAEQRSPKPQVDWFKSISLCHPPQGGAFSCFPFGLLFPALWFWGSSRPIRSSMAPVSRVHLRSYSSGSRGLF